MNATVQRKWGSLKLGGGVKCDNAGDVGTSTMKLKKAVEELERCGYR